MQITYNLPHVFSPGSSPEDNAYALKALLDCQVALNLGFLRNHSVSPLYRNRVVYGRTNWWEPIPAVLERGYGDCKSLAPWLIAEYRKAGVVADPVFRWVLNSNGVRDFHILVQTNSGFEDPSKVKGMGKDEWSKFYPKGTGQ